MTPYERARLFLWLADDVRDRGIRISAGKGTGKSRLIGRIIAWLDFIRGFPFVLFDPHGQSIDNFLDKITRMPREIQERLWPRVRYVDMSGKYNRVIPFPLYYRLGEESLYEISQRPLDVIRKLDPNLQTASILGWNPLWRTGTYVGMILAGLGFQITEAENLVRYPTMWRAHFSKLLKKHPEVLPAVTFFREFSNMTESMRNRKTDAFYNKIAMFNLDDTMQGMFGVKTPGINWNQVVNQHLAVLLDFTNVRDIERRRFMMVWTFFYFLNFIKHRGPGRFEPIGLIIDELASLLSTQVLTSHVMADEMDELINVIARNYGVWLTIAHQEQYQFSEHMQKTLQTMGTQIFGDTSDYESAQDLADQYYPYKSYWTRKTEPVWLGGQWPIIVDYRSTEYSVEEQRNMNSRLFMNQGRFNFLVRPASNAQNPPSELRSMTIARLDPGIFPNPGLVNKAKEVLVKRDGQLLEPILTEIKKRSASQIMQKIPPKSKGNRKLPKKTKPSIWTK